jgi:hypothetical protein
MRFGAAKRITANVKGDALPFGKMHPTSTFWLEGTQKFGVMAYIFGQNFYFPLKIT